MRYFIVAILLCSFLTGCGGAATLPPFQGNWRKYEDPAGHFVKFDGNEITLGDKEDSYRGAYSFQEANAEEMCIRDRLSQPREPCWKLARRWQVKDLVLQVQQTGHTGWYFRVLEPGQIQAGDSIQLIERPHPQWTVTAANQVMFARPLHPDTAALTALPELSESWRTALQNRLDREGEATR